jgi:hypothetical protein
VGDLQVAPHALTPVYAMIDLNAWLIGASPSCARRGSGVNTVHIHTTGLFHILGDVIKTSDGLTGTFDPVPGSRPRLPRIEVVGFLQHQGTRYLLLSDLRACAEVGPLVIGLLTAAAAGFFGQFASVRPR